MRLAMLRFAGCAALALAGALAPAGAADPRDFLDDPANDICL